MRSTRPCNRVPQKPGWAVRALSSLTQGRQQPPRPQGDDMVGRFFCRTGSVNVALVALLAPHPGDIFGRPVRGQLAMGSDDLMQGLIDIARHAAGIAADIEMSAFLQPREQVSPILAHAGLHIDLLGLIAREGEIEPGQHAITAHLAQFIGIDEVGFLMLVTEEQPVASACTLTAPVM